MVVMLLLWKGPRAPILDEKGDVQQEQNGEANQFQLQDVPRPGTEGVEEGWEIGFTCYKKIIAPDQLVDEKDGNHVNIRPNDDAPE